MSELEFTHSAHNTPVTVYAELVYAVMYLPTMKSVVLVGPGSTAIPVVGTYDEIKEKINAAKAAKPKES